MPTPRPLREGYPITEITKKEIKNTIKHMVNYSIKGNPKFVIGLTKINWNSLSAKNVFDVILLMLSYGLKTNKDLFEKYIKRESMRGSVSLFKFMREYDGVYLKGSLNEDSFREIFESLFEGIEQDVDVEKELNEIKTRVAKIGEKDIKSEEKANLDALIDTIISGKSVETIYVTKEENEIKL